MPRWTGGTTQRGYGSQHQKARRHAMAEQPEITARKMTGYVLASKELMDDCVDLNAVFNPTWRQRLRRRLFALRGRMAERAYRLIAGHDLPEPEPDDWDD